jgi:hypothetical protein
VFQSTRGDDKDGAGRWLAAAIQLLQKVRSIVTCRSRPAQAKKRSTLAFSGLQRKSRRRESADATPSRINQIQKNDRVSFFPG